MSEILSKEDIDYILSLTDEEIERLKKGKRYFTFFDEETSKALIAIEERKKREKKVSQPYEITKCVQVLKYIISKHPNPDIYSVLKMLYLADKIHLLKYGALIAPDKYLKLKNGPVPSLCLHIIQFVRRDEYSYVYDESIKEEFEVLEDQMTQRITKLRNITEPNLHYLSKSNIECLDEAIDKYGNCSFNELKELTHDEIYKSVPSFNDEITIHDMAKVLDKNGTLTERLREIYPYKAI